jgi:hypothetical protein
MILLMIVSDGMGIVAMTAFPAAVALLASVFMRVVVSGFPATFSPVPEPVFIVSAISSSSTYIRFVYKQRPRRERERRAAGIVDQYNILAGEQYRLA